MNKNKLRFLSIIMALLSVVLFSSTLMSSKSLASTTIIVKIPDPYLNKAVRAAIKKPTGELTNVDLANLKVLGDVDNVKSLSGLQYCVNLEVLNLGPGEISDLSPISGLTKLTELHIGPWNRITNYSPLKNLVNLESLYLDIQTNITDISFVANMTNLSHLGLMSNKVTNIAPLVKLTNLKYVNLEDNPLDLTQKPNIDELKNRGVQVLVWPLQPPTQYGELKDFIQIAAGNQHTVGLKKDGTVWAWGSNGRGELGGGTSAARPIPSLVYGVDNVTKIYSGYNQVGAITNDGSVWLWGGGFYGNGKEGSRLPIKIPALSGAVKLAFGGGPGMVLKADGTVALIDINGIIPVSGLTNVIDIACSATHFVAVRSDGTVWTWGDNYHGELGLGRVDTAYPTYHKTPVMVPTLNDVKAVAVGQYHTLALKNDGTIYGWGENGLGQLGNSRLGLIPTPTKVMDLTGIIKIAAGQYHSAAMGKNGSVWCWGSNLTGQTGPDSLGATNYAGGYYEYNPTPVINPNLTMAKDIAAGQLHAVAVEADGTVLAWGLNYSGQLGVKTPEYSTALSDTTTFSVTWDEALKVSKTYDIEYKDLSPAGIKASAVNGWKRLASRTTAKKYSFKGTVGKNYVFRVRGWDAKGSNNWFASNNKTVVPFDNESLISKRSGFSLISKKSDSAFLKTLRYSTKAGDSISYKVTGTKVGLITVKGQSQSKAKIYIDGVYQTTVDAYAKTKKYRQVLYSKSWSKPGVHVITIVNQGTKGRSRFDIDAIAVNK